MPSDDRREDLREALAEGVHTFRAVLVTTAEEVSGSLGSPGANGESSAGDRGEYGLFATGRIDSARLEALAPRREGLSATAHARLETAVATLRDVASRAGEIFEIDLESGGGLEAALSGALGEAGRAYGAARTAGAIRRGNPGAAGGTGAVTGTPVARWNELERKLVPPILIHLDAADLGIDPLLRVLEAGVRVVLAPRGEVPPAFLSRLISPGTFVMQATDPAAFECLIGREGSGVTALVSDEAARFTHDPSAGSEPWERLTLDHVPEVDSSVAAVGRSAFQASEDVAQLKALAEAPAAAATATVVPGGATPTEGTTVEERAAAPAPAPPQPVEKLAAWLLRAAELEEPT